MKGSGLNRNSRKVTFLSPVVLTENQKDHSKKTSTMPGVTGRSKGGGSTGNLVKGSMASYEDLIVAQYLDEIRKSPPYTKKGSEVPPSPYLQRLPSTHIVPTPGKIKQSLSGGRSRSRPASAHASTGYNTKSKSSGRKPKIDMKFIADLTLWDPATPREERGGGEGENGTGYKKKKRPYSAPIRPRPYSATSSTGRPASGKKGKIKPVYKRQPFTIVATAFKNGSRETFVNVAAPTIKELLEQCTDKLGLTAAARRVFLDDGIEVFSPREIPRDAEIYISQGEPFKNPFLPLKRNNMMKQGATWTMNGLVLPQEAKPGPTKPNLSKRFRQQLGKKNRRILIFKNGVGHDGGYEIVADMDNTPAFMQACTGKLDLGSHARVLYDWEGKEVTDLYETPLIDQCLQACATPVLGPLWVSKGEGFSPKGPFDFISGLLHHTKTKLREAKHYKEQLEMAKSNPDNVEIRSILAMTENEVDEALQMVERDIEELTEAKQKLKAQLEKIEPDAKEEEVQGAEFRMAKTIRKLEASDRLVGVQGIKLKVYENGTYEDETVVFFNLKETSKGIEGQKDKIMQRLLDQCGTLGRLAFPKTPAISSMPRKLYDQHGKVVTDPYALKDDMELWLSFGEGFRVPYVYCLQAMFDKVHGLNLYGEKNVGVREPLIAEEIPKDGEYSYSWEATVGFPLSYEFTQVDADMNAAEREHALEQVKNNEINVNWGFLQHKDNPRLVLFPELMVDMKKIFDSKDLWPQESQTWVISKTGYIYCKPMPQLTLAVTDMKLEGTTVNGAGTEIQGYVVALQKKMVGSPYQQWGFTADGYIYCLAYPDLVLTHLGATGIDDSMVNNAEGVLPGHKFYVAVSDKINGKDARLQRWAIKQERFDNLGQWKHSKITNPEWNKRAYSWPVNEDGNWNEDFDWPMEGFLIPGVPPLKTKEKPHGHVPLRLTVMKNGEKEMYKAVQVVGPDLTNMMKDVNKTAMNGKRPHTAHNHKHKRTRTADTDVDSVDGDPNVHCRDDLTLLQLEFMLFLERCTNLIDLPFAARRLFDEKGIEHTTLQGLKRDQLVYVSCGEAWNDPKLTKAEQQRRYLLATLGQDIAQIRQYVALRNPQDLVLAVDSALVPNAKLVVQTCCLTPEQRHSILSGEEARQKQLIEEQRKEQEEKKRQIEEMLHENRSAHERAHLKSDQRLDSLRWPWERVNLHGSFDDVINANDDSDEPGYTSPELYEKYKPKPKSSPRNVGMNLQKFKFENGHISCVYNPNLVLGVVESETRVADVVLVKKKPDDAYQRWTLTDDGFLRSKHSPSMVLTVNMPAVQRHEAEDAATPSYPGCGVTLQHKKNTKYGAANQKWGFDPELGFLYAFKTDATDMEITAANKANVCTYAVRQGESLDQPGYIVYMATSNSKSEEVIMCTSCSRAMRGQQKVRRLDRNVDFACAMGSAREKGLKQAGSFHCLNGKVDLSTFEAENTLSEWEDQFERLREERSVRVIAREINAARFIKPVKIYVYRNGEGRMKPGHVLVGSSIVGLLDQCTHALQMANAARRLYTSDGMLVLDVEDLINWAVDDYMTKIKENMKEKQAKGEIRPAPDGKGMQSDDGTLKTLEQQREASQSSGSTSTVIVHERMGHVHLNGHVHASDGEESIGDQSSVSKPSVKNPRKGSIDTDYLVQNPPLEFILRYPIEVWASAGEAFVKPEDAEEKYLQGIQNREERAAVTYELEKEKHVLRQMQGRRLEELNPGEYKPTRSTRNPVLIEGNWQEPTFDEQRKHDKVHQLQSHLSEVKAAQKEVTKTKPTVNISRNLYAQPVVKRILVFPNGEDLQHATYVWGGSIGEILDASVSRLNLMKAAKYLYTLDGKQISDFDEIKRDMILAVSTGKGFLKPRDSSVNVEVKANWGRARKQYGPKATEIMVKHTRDMNIEVDPFGPPVLATDNVKSNGHTQQTFVTESQGPLQ
ncbi:uncharacterized protein LOC106169385 isoform X2 [Lingula anatina]|uniref:Uncharacterized protein LOC106169385 isoform X2 n=1 Tax=Lingula anatina TaxID=7574 RepID=A0A1S3J1J0_LINAN|nr:uncharacterized protein LOC106169385 isoform X2 [Lingula anatina]|eukprot:XP_013404290.1 uncharacterized protein LOC106169385 isoform X2 [Lingula anatina]